MEGDHKIILPHGNSLSFHPERIKHRYGMMISYPEKGTSVHYEVICQYLKNINDSHFLLSMDRQQVFVNNAAPKLKLYQIADSMAKAFYPMELYINSKSLEIRKIGNYPQIAARCGETLKLLKTQYEGDLAASFFEQYEKQYSNVNILTDRLQDDLFYHLYFFPLYANYTEELTAISEINFPFDLDRDKPLLQVEQQINPYAVDHKIEIRLKSINPGREDNLDPDFGFEACYRLYNDDHNISSITGKAFHHFNQDKKSTIEFEMYHLDPDDRQLHDDSKESSVQTSTDSNNKDSFIISSDKVKKKSFWNIFN